MDIYRVEFYILKFLSNPFFFKNTLKKNKPEYLIIHLITSYL